MKKTAVIALAICIVLLTGCAGNAIQPESVAPSVTPTATPAPTPTPAPTAAPTPSPTPEPTPDPLEPYRALFDDREGTADANGVTVEYNVYSPVKGENDTEKYPVMIWLHGMGQGLEPRAPLSESDVAKFATEQYQQQFGDGAYIVVPRANEDDGEVMYGFFTTNSWMADADEDGKSDQLAALQNAIHDFLRDESANVDADRVYIGGFSAGGYMTWQELLAEPELFAAAYPICPAYAPTEAELETVKDTPIWLISGVQDPTVSYKQYVEPVWSMLSKITTTDQTRLSAIEYILEGDGRTPVAMQHFAWVAVTNNMLFDDGSPYDEKYPDGFIAWLAAQSITK